MQGKAQNVKDLTHIKGMYGKQKDDTLKGCLDRVACRPALLVMHCCRSKLMLMSMSQELRPSELQCSRLIALAARLTLQL